MSSSRILLVALVAVLALPLLVSSLSLRTYSDSSCSQPLSYSYVNSSLTSNYTVGCFPAGAAGDSAITAYSVYCAPNQRSNDSSLAITVEVTALTNSTQCSRDSGNYPVVVWDVTSDRVVAVVNGTNQWNYYTADGTCVPLTAQLGQRVGNYLYNQTQAVYGIVSCTGVVDRPNSAAPSVSARLTPLAAMVASALLYVLL